MGDRFFSILVRSAIQDLETGCPKLAIAQLLGILYLKGNIQIVTINMLSFIEIRYDILIQSNGNYVEVRKKSIICWKVTFYEITHKYFWVSWGIMFEGLGVQITPRRPASEDDGQDRDSLPT